MGGEPMKTNFLPVLIVAGVIAFCAGFGWWFGDFAVSQFGLPVGLGLWGAFAAFVDSLN